MIHGYTFEKFLTTTILWIMILVLAVSINLAGFRFAFVGILRGILIGLFGMLKA
jgi:hypothetical protein